MPRDLIRLSEFDSFLNDDVDGNRLAEFLRKRTDAKPILRRVFREFSPDESSISVHLEKIPTTSAENAKSPQSQTYEALDARPSGTKDNINEVNTSQRLRKSISRSGGREDTENINTSCASGERVSPMLRKYNTRSGGKKNRNRSRRHNQSSKMGSGGRRTLLKEFENTARERNFLPNLFSTPRTETITKEVNASKEKSASKNISAASLVSKNSFKDTHQMHLNEKLYAAVVVNPKETTLGGIKTNQGKNHIPLSPKHSRRRSYTIEKGNSLGQIILTPARAHLERVGESSILANKQNTPKKNNFIQVTSNELLMTAPNEFAVMCDSRPISVTSVTKPLHSNDKALVSDTQITLQASQDSKIPTIVIPVHQTINVTSLRHDETLKGLNAVDNEKINGTKLRKSNEKITKVFTDNRPQQNNEVDVSVSHLPEYITEDDMPLNEMLTDDDDDNEENNGHRMSDNMPINLANPIASVRSLRKRLSNKLPKLASTKIGPPTAHAVNITRKRSQSARCKAPLNKAPSSPINGEKYAVELKQTLARLTNYQIIDLRKRNSIGKIFRKSAIQPQLIKDQQLQLEKEIQWEMLKRNIDVNQEFDVQPELESVPRVEETTVDAEILEEILPAPAGFNDNTVPPIARGSDIVLDSLVDEPSSDRVSFIQFSDASRSRKRTKDKTMPKLVQNYFDITKGVLKKTRNQTRSQSEKRRLYSKGLSDSEEATSSIELNRNNVTEDVEQPQFSPLGRSSVTCSSIMTSTSTANKSKSPKKRKKSSAELDDTGIFKKPRLPAQKKRVERKLKGVVTDECASAYDTTNISLRRSKRPHKPSNHNLVSLPLYQLLNDGYICKGSMDTKTKKKSQNTNTAKSVVAEPKHNDENQNSAPVYSLLGDTNASSASSCVSRTNERQQTTRSTPKTHTTTTIALENRRILVPQAPVHEINQMFNEFEDGALAEFNPSSSNNVPEIAEANPSSMKVPNTKIKKLRVRIQRLKLDSNGRPLTVQNKQNSISNNVMSGTSSPPDVELLSWLKGISDTKISSEQKDTFVEMRVSAASNLVFTDLEGIDYAFYDTEEKASLGYLRFRPGQIKEPKRAKKFKLHFVVLEGQFKIGNDKEVGVFGMGDLVSIKIASRYFIENITNAIGLLMVVKK